MKIQITKLVGGDNYIFTIEDEQDMGALFKAGFLASMPTKCNECGEENVHLASNKATSDKGTFIFVYMQCVCGAKAQIGQYQTGGLFWKKFEKYNPDKKING
jgi:hypothetical protein